MYEYVCKLKKQNLQGAMTYDLDMYHSEKNPESGRMGQLSLLYLVNKFYHYGRAMEHVLNTGL